MNMQYQYVYEKFTKLKTKTQFGQFKLLIRIITEAPNCYS